MRLFRRKSNAEPEQVPWTVEYRLRLLHMPRKDGTCTGCERPYEFCPTLALLDRYMLET